jgi:hypothetical protein
MSKWDLSRYKNVGRKSYLLVYEEGVGVVRKEEKNIFFLENVQKSHERTMLDDDTSKHGVFNETKHVVGKKIKNKIGGQKGKKESERRPRIQYSDPSSGEEHHLSDFGPQKSDGESSGDESKRRHGNKGTVNTLTLENLTKHNEKNGLKTKWFQFGCADCGKYFWAVIR